MLVKVAEIEKELLREEINSSCQFIQNMIAM